MKGNTEHTLFDSNDDWKRKTPRAERRAAVTIEWMARCRA